MRKRARTGREKGLLLFSLAYEEFPPSVCHDETDAEHVVCWPQTSGGNVALWEEVVVSCPCALVDEKDISLLTLYWMGS